ncbi:MAG: nucleotidyltransferase domain-containing protein [Oscillospiraceae bacterium]|nr:nucleotidyltransferase domain-containing protein [Oscillospiraceae bacterium]
MVDIKLWMNEFLKKLDETFPNRIWFVGLQGSYARGEATETSDLDVVAILEELTHQDLERYGAMLDMLSHRELICGFVSGRRELMNWEASDLFQFYHDTLPIRGSLDELLPKLDAAAVNRAIRIGACNLYHGCIHNLLHDKSEDMVRGLYKSASFVVQAICFRQTGHYVRRQSELRELVSGDDRRIVDTFLYLKAGGEVSFREMSEQLFHWAKTWIEKTGE